MLTSQIGTNTSEFEAVELFSTLLLILQQKQSCDVKFTSTFTFAEGLSQA